MPENSFRILSLDGGGIRGAFVAGFLAEIERKLGRPVADHFDLLAGTSTGGIIATGLALGIPAATIEQFYLDKGVPIFARPPAPRRTRPINWALRRCVGDIDTQWLRGSKYAADPLRAALVEVFGQRTLEEARRRLVVPAVDLTRAQTVVFKTPHLPGMERDRDLRAVDVVLATTAAPSYFPPASIGAGSCYCDGGLWANNPTLVAVVEAVRIQRECRRPGVDRPFTLSDVRVLSVGTGEHPYFVDTGLRRPPGLVYWGPRLMDVVGASQSQGFEFLTQHLLGPGRCTRVTFPLPDRSWKLDAVERLERLVHIGREAAIARIAALEAATLATTASGYVAFPRAGGPPNDARESPRGDRSPPDQAD